MSVGGTQEGKHVFWTTTLDDFLLLSALTQHTSSLVQSVSACVGLKRYKAYVLMELRVSAGRCSYWQGKATGTVLGGKEERCTFLLDRGTLRKFWTGDNPTPLPFHRICSTALPLEDCGLILWV